MIRLTTRRKSPEHQFQCELMAYLAVNKRPELVVFAIGNGELRHINVAKRLKAEGVLPGVADICIMMEEGQVAWLELKAKGGRMSDEQLGFQAQCKRLGHPYACVDSMGYATIVLMSWRVLKPDARPPITSIGQVLNV